MNRFFKFRSHLLSIIFVCCTGVAMAQKPFYTTYEWDKKPQVAEIPDDAKSFPAVVIRHHFVTEYYAVVGVVKSEVRQLTTEHKIVHVNSNAGIESFNKVSIPLHGGRELVSLKVRAINPDGKVTEFKSENLKELKNVDGYGNYKIFAIEGLTLGGELEYIYTVKSGAQSYGRQVFQSDVPVLEALFMLLHPAQFGFTVKSYNGMPYPKKRSLDHSQTAMVAEAKVIPALPKEEYSAYHASLMRVDYKVASNGAMTWNSLSEKLLAHVYDGKGLGKLEKTLRSLNLEGKTDLEKVRGVERYIKDNFTIQEGGNDAYEEIKEILATHVANEYGLVKIYMSCWEVLNVKNLLVFGSDRFKGPIDREFPLPTALNEILFYFPSIKMYLTPDDRGLRAGAPPDNVAGSTALFLTYARDRANSVGLDLEKYDLVFVEPLGYEHNKLGVHASVSFGESPANPKVIQENFFQGYRAFQFRDVLASLSADKQDNFFKTVTLSDIDNPAIIKREVEGKDLDLSEDPDNYLRIKTEYTAPALVEQAGNDFLVSVGKLIGKQSQLYQERQRQTDVEFHSISNYNHELVVQIPDGYACSGLEALRINHEVKVKEKPVMWFKSDYTLTGNTLTIKINEVYAVLSLPKEKYEDFRKVVNSAADFNKLVVVMQPK